MKPKAMCHITRQASINAQLHMPWFIPNLNSQASSRDESIHIIFENERWNVISLNQPQGMSAKMAVNEIRTHACTNQRHTLA